MDRTEHVVIDYGTIIGPFVDWESADAFRIAHAPNAEVRMLWSPSNAVRMLL